MSARQVPIPPSGFREIHVLRLSSLGDVVLALPVVHALAAAWPGARRVFWVFEEYRDVVRFDPAIDHVRVLEADARRPEDLLSMSAELEDADLIVDLHGNLRTRVLTFRQEAPVLRAASYRLRRGALVHARALRLPPPPPALERYARALAPLGLAAPGPPRLATDPGAEPWAEALVAAAGTPLVALLPGAKHFTKRWPEEHWIALTDRLLAAGRSLVVCSLESERRALPNLAARIAAGPRATWCVEPFPRIAALLGRVAAAVSSDSGLMHVAAARGARVVALFGSTAPELGFAPAGEGHVVLCRHEPCQPCTIHGRRECPRGHFRCMRELRPEEVAAAVDRVSGGSVAAVVGSGTLR